jgi:Putative, 10TM heavy-metal exporter
MLSELGGTLGQAAMITVFVAVMMIAVEYLNVLTHGTFETALRGSPWTQYLAAAALGATPGCLGAFTVVALYSHRVVTLGAVVACMIATSGDEAFVMLALFPRVALWLTLSLAVLGFLVAPVVDRLAGPARLAPESCARMTVHAEECRCFSVEAFLRQWRHPVRSRILLSLGLWGYVVWIVFGGGGLPGEWNWVRATLLFVGAFGVFVVSSVPDHFLREHLWRHVAVQHVPRIFAWTAGVLVGVALLARSAHLGTLVRENPWVMLVAAGLIGLIPESGPHLVFVSLYAAGRIPISILTASSIVQDGHGMLPLLAQSRKAFLRVKAVNLLAGLAVGAAMLALGF